MHISSNIQRFTRIWLLTWSGDMPISLRRSTQTFLRISWWVLSKIASFHHFSKNSGLVYVHGRDNRFRPIIILQAFRIDIKKVNIMWKKYLEYIESLGQYRWTNGGNDIFSGLCDRKPHASRADRKLELHHRLWSNGCVRSSTPSWFLFELE